MYPKLIWKRKRKSRFSDRANRTRAGLERLMAYRKVDYLHVYAKCCLGSIRLELNSLFHPLGCRVVLMHCFLGESQGRVVIGVESTPTCRIAFQSGVNGFAVVSLGRSNSSGKLQVDLAGEKIVDLEVSSLQSAMENAIPKHMEFARS